MANYWIKVPKSGQRRTYAILRRENGKAVTMKDSRVDIINRLVRDGKLDHEQATKDVKSIVAEFYAREIPERDRPLNVNVELAEQFWRDTYEQRPIDASSRRSANNALNRTLKALGAVSISSGSLGELQQSLERVKPSGRTHVALFINSLLRYIGRKEKVKIPKGTPPDIQYLTLGEFPNFIDKVPEPYRLVVTVAFATGARLGEVFAIRRIVKKGSVWIDRQLKDDLTYGPTKNRKSRAATVIPFYLSKVEEWLQVPESEKKRIRLLDWANIVADASEDALGKRLVFHGMRHSYAVYWASIDVPLKKVANCLGDSLFVTEKYYASYFITDDDEDQMLAKVKRAG